VIEFRLNGREVEVEVPLDMPLLWVLRDVLALTGTKYGCGVGVCGACTVHLNGRSVFSCRVPMAAVVDQEVTTIEGLSADAREPLLSAWLEEQVTQCGYCQVGMIMRAAALIAELGRPSREQIVTGMSMNVCRCGTYNRVIRAVERVVEAMGDAPGAGGLGHADPSDSRSFRARSSPPGA